MWGRKLNMKKGNYEKKDRPKIANDCFGFADIDIA